MPVHNDGFGYTPAKTTVKSSYSFLSANDRLEGFSNIHIGNRKLLLCDRSAHQNRGNKTVPCTTDSVTIYRIGFVIPSLINPKINALTASKIGTPSNLQGVDVIVVGKQFVPYGHAPRALKRHIQEKAPLV